MPARDVIVDVKYQCTCGIECNIEHLYWSDTCSKLVCPSLTCSREEIESYYCNLVLENMSTQEAMQYQNRSSNGFVCPDCEATLSTMKCTEKSPELLMMQVISNEREAPYESRTDELIQQFKSKFHPPSNNHTRATPHRFPIGPWKWQDMEDQLQRKIPEHERTSILNPLGTQTPWFERVSDRLRQATDPSQLSTRTQKLQQPMISSIFRQDLVPLRPLLRTKRSRKCLDAVVKHNQPGFLVKPQVGPLTGDSSMYGSTSWFKKANLALGYIPHVTVEKLPFRSQADPQMIEMWLRFRNPLDDNVKIECAFHTSSMQLQTSDMEFDIGPKEDQTIVLFDSDAQDEEDDDIESNGDSIVSKAHNHVVLRLQALEPEYNAVLETHVTIQMQIQDEGREEKLEFHLHVNFGDMERISKEVTKNSPPLRTASNSNISDSNVE